MNGNIFNPQQNNGYYPYQYNAAMPTMTRPDLSTYMMPQVQPPAQQYMKGRPVTSLEEAKVAQIDLDGSIFIFPDLGNKKIYTKRINPDGTATLHSYVLESVPEEQPILYATKEEVSALKSSLDEILLKLNAKTDTSQPQQKFTF